MNRDTILPGAFTQSLQEHKSKGTMPGLYAEHSDDLLPVGSWLDMEPSGHHRPPQLEG